MENIQRNMQGATHNNQRHNIHDDSQLAEGRNLGVHQIDNVVDDRSIEELGKDVLDHE